MRHLLALLVVSFVAAAVNADELADAKKEYLRIRREANKQLYEAYKSAIQAADTKGLRDESQLLRDEMDSFVAREREVLNLTSDFDLFTAINKASIALVKADNLGTAIQKRDATGAAIEQLSKAIYNKPFTATFVIKDIHDSNGGREMYTIEFSSCRTADAATLVQTVRYGSLRSYSMKLSERDAKRIAPGDTIVLRGMLRGEADQAGTNQVRQGTQLLSIDFSNNNRGLDRKHLAAYYVGLVSCRAQLVLQPKVKSPPVRDTPATDK